MPTAVREIPLLDLVSWLIETPDAPVHVGSVQILQAPRGKCRAIVARVVDGLRAAPVGDPFDLVPLFAPLTRPKWGRVESMDPQYHVRHVSLPAPGSEKQLIDLVMELHTPLLDRDRPGWIAYVIDGLAENRFAIYWKVHHAYIDGASAVMRFEASVARSADDLEVRAPWSPLPGHEPREAAAPRDLGAIAGAIAGSLRTGGRASKDLFGMLGRSLAQAGGFVQREVPLPFSAPRSVFNAPVHAVRRLGVGSLPLERFRALAKAASVSVNDVALTIVGEALERYAVTRDQPLGRPLVAVCPMSIRAPGDTTAGTQFAAISVKLGEPGADPRERIAQVHASSREAKEEARGLSREALIAWLAILGATADAIGKSPLADLVPPATNVNVSNVPGPTYRCFLAGAEQIASYPVSTLAGGTAINITFASASGRMDYAVITDARALPDPELIASLIAEALDALEQAFAPKPKSKSRRRKAGAASVGAGHARDPKVGAGHARDSRAKRAKK